MDNLTPLYPTWPSVPTLGWDPLYLPIAYEYRPLFERLAASCARLAHHPGFSPEQRSLLAKLHYALGRLPVLTLDVDFIVILARTQAGSGPLGSYALELSNLHFQASTTPAPALAPGGDGNFSRVVYLCTNEGFRQDGDEDGYVSYALFEGWVRGWESLCQDPHAGCLIYNECEAFDWHQFQDIRAWDQMPSLFSTYEGGQLMKPAYPGVRGL